MNCYIRMREGQFYNMYTLNFASNKDYFERDKINTDTFRFTYNFWKLIWKYVLNHARSPFLLFKLFFFMKKKSQNDYPN